MNSHLIYTGVGIYEPVICPKCVLWQRVPPDEGDPLYGVFVPSVSNARKFAQVTVVMGRYVISQFEQEER